MEFRPGVHMGPQPPVGSLQQRIMSPRLRAQQEVLSHHMPQRKLSRKADEILEKLGYMRGGRVTRKMAALVDDVADMSRERLVERRAMLELVGRPDPGREAMFWGGRQSAGESPPVKSLEEILLDADAASRRAERRKEILSKLVLSKMEANVSQKEMHQITEDSEPEDFGEFLPDEDFPHELASSQPSYRNHPQFLGHRNPGGADQKSHEPYRLAFDAAEIFSKRMANARYPPFMAGGMSNAAQISSTVKEKLREKLGCAPDMDDVECMRPLQPTMIENTVRTGVSTRANVDLRTLMTGQSGGPPPATGGDYDTFRNVFFLAECFPRFVEEYNFIMQTLFHAPKMPSAHFYDGLLKLGLEETMQYFRMSDAERSAIWDGWTEEGPKKPRRRAEIDFFKLVTDASVRDGDVLKMPHPENRIVLRGANLIVDSRNTEHHFYARVFSRGSGKNNVVNNIVFNKVTKRVEMDSDVRKTHLPEKPALEDLEICDDEKSGTEYDSDDDPLAEFRCPLTGKVRRPRCEAY